jgi:hypothetical protein
MSMTIHYHTTPYYSRATAAALVLHWVSSTVSTVLPFLPHRHADVTSVLVTSFVQSGSFICKSFMNHILPWCLA